MKSFKLVDPWIQIGLLFSCFIYALFTELINMLFAYIAIGGWQLLSTLLNMAFAGAYPIVKDRRYYRISLLVVAILAILCLPVWIFYGYALLFVSPIMAIWYFYICYEERILLLKEKPGIEYDIEK